ncbi:hypothetical protein ACB092_05G027600 [Castanea dentata]
MMMKKMMGFICMTHVTVSFPEFQFINIHFQRAIWGWDDSHIFIGNMKRGVDVISPTLEKTIFNLQSPHMSAVPRRFDAHPLTVGMLAGGTCLGQVFMWTLT